MKLLFKISPETLAMLERDGYDTSKDSDGTLELVKKVWTRRSTVSKNRTFSDAFKSCDRSYKKRVEERKEKTVTTTVTKTTAYVPPHRQWFPEPESVILREPSEIVKDCLSDTSEECEGVSEASGPEEAKPTVQTLSDNELVIKSLQLDLDHELWVLEHMQHRKEQDFELMTFISQNDSKECTKTEWIKARNSYNEWDAKIALQREKSNELNGKIMELQRTLAVHLAVSCDSPNFSALEPPRPPSEQPPLCGGVVREPYSGEAQRRGVAAIDLSKAEAKIRFLEGELHLEHPKLSVGVELFMLQRPEFIDDHLMDDCYRKKIMELADFKMRLLNDGTMKSRTWWESITRMIQTSSDAYGTWKATQDKNAADYNRKLVAALEYYWGWVSPGTAVAYQLGKKTFQAIAG